MIYRLVYHKHYIKILSLELENRVAFIGELLIFFRVVD